jgi:hypothetical protein
MKSYNSAKVLELALPVKLNPVNDLVSENYKHGETDLSILLKFSHTKKRFGEEWIK